LLLITAIWLGAISTVALWMQCGSTRPGPSTAGDAPATESMADEPPAPGAQEGIEPREARNNPVVTNMSQHDEREVSDTADAPSRQTADQRARSPSRPSQPDPREHQTVPEAPTPTSLPEAIAAHADQRPATTAHNARKPRASTWKGGTAWQRQ